MDITISLTDEQVVALSSSIDSSTMMGRMNLRRMGYVDGQLTVEDILKELVKKQINVHVRKATIASFRQEKLKLSLSQKTKVDNENIADVV